VINIWDDYKLTEERAKRTAQSLASALDEHAARTFGEAYQTLLNVNDAINMRGGIDASNELILHKLLSLKKQQQPQIGEIIVVNSRGIVLASSGTYPIGYVNVAAKEYFIHLRENPTSDFFISRPLQIAFSKLWQIVMARGIKDSSGRFQGVVAILITSDYFNKFYKSIDVGPGGFLDLVRSDGYSLIHEPYSEIYTTINFSKHPLFTQQLPKASFGTYFSQSPITSKTYLRSYRAVTGFPIVAVISLSKDDIFNRWGWRAWRQGISAVILLALVFILSMVIFSHLKKLEIAEEALRQSQDDLNRAQSVAQTGSWRLVMPHNELIWSDETYRIFGIPQGGLLNYETFLGAVHPEDREFVDQKWTKALQGEPYDIEHRIIVGNAIKWVREKAELEIGSQGELIGALGTVQDITERKQAEEEIRAYQQKLRSLTSELFLTEERQRRQLATDLHDHIGQTLAVAKIKLGVLRKVAEPSELTIPLGEVQKLIEQMMQEIRSLTFELSLPVLYELGFEAAVEWFAKHVRDIHGIQMDVEREMHPIRLKDEIKLLLFRSVRELMLNIVKHAQAKHARVTISPQSELLRIEVEDDGLGIPGLKDLARFGDSEGFGLFSIRERLDQVGGHLQVQSKEGHGTLVILTIPLLPGDQMA